MERIDPIGPRPPGVQHVPAVHRKTDAEEERPDSRERRRPPPRQPPPPPEDDGLPHVDVRV